MSLLDTIRDSWGWTGLDPSHVIESNPFGNLIVVAADGSCWRICPEECSCVQVAPDRQSFDTVFSETDFQQDWQMTVLAGVAIKTLGKVPEGHCYCLKLPAILGGAYGVENIGTIPLHELISFSGDLAHQLKDVADGPPDRIKDN